MKPQTKPKSKAPAATKPTAHGAAAVAAFLEKLEHPRKADIATVRQIILGVSPTITETIKWNAPNFRTTEDFATFHLRARDRVQLIFHLGAKRRDPLPAIDLADPAGLVQWLAKDRCLVTLGVTADIAVQARALQDVVRCWITYV